MILRCIKKTWLRAFLMAAVFATVPAAAWAGDTPTRAPAGWRPVEITVHVPAGARLWFDSHETAQTGTQRVFISPPVEPGRDFAYEVRVQWRDGEKLIDRTRRLAVRAGDQIGLDSTGRGLVEVRGYAATRDYTGLGGTFGRPSPVEPGREFTAFPPVQFGGFRSPSFGFPVRRGSGGFRSPGSTPRSDQIYVGL
jgi:uncharacterized protein (TIGR03000 family)